jgi:hypothetical protein
MPVSKGRKHLKTNIETPLVSTLYTAENSKNSTSSRLERTTNVPTVRTNASTYPWKPQRHTIERLIVSMSSLLGHKFCSEFFCITMFSARWKDLRLAPCFDYMLSVLVSFEVVFSVYYIYSYMYIYLFKEGKVRPLTKGMSC